MTVQSLDVGFEDETSDAEAALGHLRSVVDGPLVVLGHSVGGTIAIRLASRALSPGVSPPGGFARRWRTTPPPTWRPSPVPSLP